ncbi:helix-turn-helix domain-containing protein, partial [Candidatus Pelagadaptatus aseana]|uniref:helix-turn-helix domain-containing protein n=1 Tax=Candidatus Pelagadaptatus aseana TaxID=3120508 RepID=UPI003C6F5253
LKLETGHTALENIHIYQIDRAKNLLLGSNDSVATVAYALGFEYPQYFSRLFRNKVGMTPTEYRNQAKH